MVYRYAPPCVRYTDEFSQTRLPSGGLFFVLHLNKPLLIRYNLTRSLVQPKNIFSRTKRTIFKTDTNSKPVAFPNGIFL